MPTHCLICNSTAVMSKDAAKAIALLIGTLNGFLRGVRQARAQTPRTASEPDSPLEQALNLMIDGLSGAVSGSADSTEFIKDVQKYHFMNYGYLCLRCGAQFDEPDSP